MRLDAREEAEIRRYVELDVPTRAMWHRSTLLDELDATRADLAAAKAELDVRYALGKENGAKLAIADALDQVAGSGELPEQFMSGVPQWDVIIGGIVARATAAANAECERVKADLTLARMAIERMTRGDVGGKR